MRNVTSLLVACGVAVAMVSSLAAQTVEGHATVVRVKGAARYKQGDTWRGLKVGDTLAPGCIVQTGLDHGSYVDLVLSDEEDSGGLVPVVSSGASKASVSKVNYKARAEQNIVRLNENTALGIDKLISQNTGAGVVTETQLDLKQGRITANVKKLTPGSKYEIKLPNGVAGVRGTLFDISADGLVRVRAGSVVVAYVGSDGQVTTQVVNGNEQYDAPAKKLTPLPPGAIQTLSVALADLRAGVGAYTTSMESMDETIRHVSPGGNDQGQNNNNQGENEQ